MTVLLPTIGAALTERHWFWGRSACCRQRCGNEADLKRSRDARTGRKHRFAELMRPSETRR
jgi:hypothetical protein